MYLYETHLHTSPVSKCAHCSVMENLEFYKQLGYAGVFITNHFIDGNMAPAPGKSYEERINFFCSDYSEGVKIGKEIGLDIFLGAEMTYGGTDFLVYGLDQEWYLSHPEIQNMKKSELLPFLMKQGALVIHAHPFREAYYIDHIRLYPRCVHGVEVYNACRKDFENALAEQYAQNYKLIPFAGSDNHLGKSNPMLGGMKFETPLKNEADFVERIKNKSGTLFHMPNPLSEQNS